MKKQILLAFHLIYIVPCLFFSSGVFSQDLSYDKDFLESLPDEVRDDVENELEISSKENKTKISKRPSSRLSKLDTVKKWERFLSEEYALNNGTERYGLSIFRTMQTSFMPINEPNFDSNYIVDFGDSFNIKVTGSKNTEYSADVQRDGSVFIENVGNVFISGLDISQAIATIKNKFNSTIIGEDIFINLSEVRDIQVLITGDSFAPGIYTLNGNTNILHALSMSGGIKEAGSLRSLDIKRNGKKIKEYGFDIKGIDHPIIPIMIYDEKKAVKMSEELLKKNIYVIAFSYPVVATGQARIRVQISSDHSREQLDYALQAFHNVGTELNII